MTKHRYQLTSKQTGARQEVVIEADIVSTADMICESQYGSSFYWYRLA
jgi:hypothetical protein